jgi:Ala-tRNA(Pro) deacylase
MELILLNLLGEVQAMIPVKVREYLKHERAPFEVIPHPETYTAQETAASEHVPGSQVAKVVIVKADDRDIMTVIPAPKKLDLMKLSSVVGTGNLRLESENEFSSLFPDCERGAMPPLGPLYRIPCFIDAGLTRCKELVFNAGNHMESLRMRMPEFLRIAEAEIADLAADE